MSAYSGSDEVDLSRKLDSLKAEVHRRREEFKTLESKTESKVKHRRE